MLFLEIVYSDISDFNSPTKMHYYAFYMYDYIFMG